MKIKFALSLALCYYLAYLYLDPGFDMTDPTDLKDPTENPQRRKRRVIQVGEALPIHAMPRPGKISKPNKRTRSLVEGIANGLTIAAAGRAAGYPLLDRPELDQKPAAAYQALHDNTSGIREMLAETRAETARDNKITRAMVIEGLKEAVDMSRTLAEPAIMVAAWREIGKMCGFYEPVKISVDLTTGGASLQTRITTMSDADLLRLAAGARLNEQGEIVDSTCERVDDEQGS